MIRTLKSSEKAVLKLRALYESRGYSRFKMSKFEEYDIYAANRDFLDVGGIITFTDPAGKLMALKPDVTMSIIKNSKSLDGGCEKLYYNENVYRIHNGSNQVTEIMQSGLECIGDIDLYSTCEVISIAAKSLSLFDRDFVLDISHMGIVSELIDELSLSDSEKKEVISCISAKNIHELHALLGVKADKLTSLLTIDPSPAEALKELSLLCDTKASIEALSELESIIAVLDKTGCRNIRLDFSVVQDLSYYNGVVFQGFIKGIPEKVLTGGRYDPLMKRIGKNSGAIGFGIDINQLEKTFDSDNEYDADIALVYKPDDDIGTIMIRAEELAGDGKRVAVTSKIGEKAKYKEIIYV